MGIPRLLLLGSLIALGVLVASVVLRPASVQFVTVLDEFTSMKATSYVHAGVPFLVQDKYAIQLCISTRSGQPLPPFILPANQPNAFIAARTSREVQAGVPFVLQDSNGTQICVSTRGGKLFPPFVVPK